MTVAELITRLQDFDEEQEVMFSYPSGDYWNNQLAAPVGSIELTDVIWSEYHRTNKVPDPDDIEKDDESKPVVLLCY